MGADGENQTQLTTNAFEDREPIFSPDGARITFSSDRDGDLDIIVMGADGQSQTPITANATPDREPAFSADGTLILFRKIDAGFDQIWQMDPSGQSPRQLTIGPDDESPSSQPLNPPALDLTAGKQKSPKHITVTLVSQNENATATLGGTLKAPKPKSASASKAKTVTLDARDGRSPARRPGDGKDPGRGQGREGAQEVAQGGQEAEGDGHAPATDDLGATASDPQDVKYKKKKGKK